MVIEATSVDRGADISVFSQYPLEKEFLWVPCSFVQRAQAGGFRVEVVDGGLVTFVPVRVNLNLKTETVEELLEKKKSMHMTAFEFRVNELKQRLHDDAKAGNAEAILERDKHYQGAIWKKVHTVEGFIEAQVKKVKVVLENHRGRSAAEYSDDAVYRSLVAESLEVASMAQSALQWWLRDAGQTIHIVENYTLLSSRRFFESFLRLRYAIAATTEARCEAALELCKARNLMRVDVHEKDGNGEQPLVALAARGASAGDVGLLVAAGADVGAIDSGQTALFIASMHGHASVVEALLDQAADINLGRTHDGATPLWVASISGHVSVVKVLLARGAAVNQANTNSGTTPLYIASQRGFVSVVEELLARGADVNFARTNDGTSPLFMASMLGHTSVVTALLAHGANVNQATTDDSGTTPLLIASNNGHTSVVDALLTGGAVVNQATIDDGRTPLYAASEAGHFSVVEALLARGADVNQARTDDGQTPLNAASRNGYPGIVEALLARGADRTYIDIASNASKHASQHAAAMESHQNAGSIVVNRHRGGGYVTSEYLLQFLGFNTFVADVKLCGRCFYFETHVVDIVGVVQFGVCTQGFQPCEKSSDGAGDDAWSWAVDGARLLKWHDGRSEAYGSKWIVGDVIGVVVDMRTAGCATLSVSVNGSFAAPNGVAFINITAPFLLPALSGDGQYRVNFGERPFVHAPPDADHVSVYAFHRQKQ
jgi:ankyrin repeat protein